MIKTVTADKVQMDYAVFGNGKKPLVIIPGLSLGSVMPSADSVCERYKEGENDFTFYLFDRRKNAPSGYTIREMAEDTADVMESIGLRNAYVFGASQGGIIALCIAANHPVLVDKLALGSTLVSSNPTSDEVIGRWVKFAESDKKNELITDMLEIIYSESTLKKYRDILMNSFSDISSDELRQFSIMAKAAVGISVIDIIDKIECPATVIGSLGDRVTTSEGSRELAEVLNCEMYLYDEIYGHGVYDEADDYPHRILTFFKS